MINLKAVVFHEGMEPLLAVKSLKKKETGKEDLCVCVCMCSGQQDFG